MKQKTNEESVCAQCLKVNIRQAKQEMLKKLKERDFIISVLKDIYVDEGLKFIHIDGFRERIDKLFETKSTLKENEKK